MNKLQIFNFSELNKEVRTLTDEHQEIWFVAKDLAEILGYAETSVMLRRMDNDETTKISITPKSHVELRSTFLVGCESTQSITISIINESGLYNAILGSKKSEAKKFKKWITNEVIPSIRKTGSYSMHNLTKLQILEMALESEKKLIESQKLLEEQKPKVEGYKAFLDTKNCHDMQSLAKLLCNDGIIIGRNKLFKILREKAILMANNIPYQEYINQEYFKLHDVIINQKDVSKTVIQILVTKKGCDFIRKIVKNINQ